MSEKTTYPNFNRPPKKFTAKSLHGRVRAIYYSYKDLRRFLTFAINVFGWDTIEAPLNVSGKPAGDPHAGLIIATGPAQYDYEGVTPGHMDLCLHWAEDKLEPICMQMEIDMETPLEETVRRIVEHGGKIVVDKNELSLARVPDDSQQCWEPQVLMKDPGGNYVCLWKCPSSRTWNELETEYDRV